LFGFEWSRKLVDVGLGSEHDDGRDHRGQFGHDGGGA
jgi:hypothetical protein